MRGPSRSVSRRSVLLGSAAVASAIAIAGDAETTEAAEPATPAQTNDLVALGVQFARLRRRCARQRRSVRQLAEQAEELAGSRGIRPVGHGKRHNAARDALRDEVGYHGAWARWSATADEIAALNDRIARHPARGINDMIIKYEALQWSLLDDGALFDTAVRRQVVTFRRDLAALAGSRQSCLRMHWPCRPEHAC